MNTLNRNIIMVALAGLVAVGVVGCGNKGPLVLPERPAAEPQADWQDEALPEADEETAADDVTDPS